MAGRTRRPRGQADSPAGAGAAQPPACGPTICQLAADPLGEIAAEVGEDLVADGSFEGLSEALARANLTAALAKGRDRDRAG